MIKGGIHQLSVIIDYTYGSNKGVKENYEDNIYVNIIKNNAYIINAV